jgi:hypothetical protein
MYHPEYWGLNLESKVNSFVSWGWRMDRRGRSGGRRITRLQARDGEIPNPGNGPGWKMEFHLKKMLKSTNGKTQEMVGSADQEEGTEKCQREGREVEGRGGREGTFPAPCIAPPARAPGPGWPGN